MSETAASMEAAAAAAGGAGDGLDSPPLPPRVYVLLLNWKGWRDTIECLESVFRQRYENYRVIVCDNDSPDDSVERIEAWAAGAQAAPAASSPRLQSLSSPPVAKPIATVVYDRETAEAGGAPDADPALVVIRTGSNGGFAAGNNVGIRYALARGDADFIWLLNNDTVVDAEALATMVARAMMDPAVGMVGSKLLYYDQPDRIQAIAGGRLTPWRGLAAHVGAEERDDGRWRDPVEVDVILGASLLVRRELLAEVGLLDERYFMYSEELDWCWSAHKAGWKLVYAPGSVVWHKVGRSVGHRSPLQEYHATRGTLLFMQKHFPQRLPLAFAYGLYRTLLPKLVRIQPARARAVLRAYRDHLRGSDRRAVHQG